MKVLLKITLLLFPFWAKSQSVQVYINDTTFTTEPVVLTGTDSTNGKIQAVYPRFNHSPAYEVNYYYGYKTGFVRVMYPGTTQLMHTLVYAKGQLNGENIWYSPAGKVVIRGMYENNVKEGFWTYKNYNFMGNYKNGLKHGTWRFVSADGEKQKISFKKGVLKRNKKGNTVLPTNVPKSILMDGVITL